jgi:hypothetical protein
MAIFPEYRPSDILPDDESTETEKVTAVGLKATNEYNTKILRGPPGDDHDILPAAAKEALEAYGQYVTLCAFSFTVYLSC